MFKKRLKSSVRQSPDSQTNLVLTPVESFHSGDNIVNNAINRVPKKQVPKRHAVFLKDVHRVAVADESQVGIEVRKTPPVPHPIITTQPLPMKLDSYNKRQFQNRKRPGCTPKNCLKTW